MELLACQRLGAHRGASSALMPRKTCGRNRVCLLGQGSQASTLENACWAQVLSVAAGVALELQDAISVSQAYNMITAMPLRGWEPAGLHCGYAQRTHEPRNSQVIIHPGVLQRVAVVAGKHGLVHKLLGTK